MRMAKLVVNRYSILNFLQDHLLNFILVISNQVVNLTKQIFYGSGTAAICFAQRADKLWYKSEAKFKLCTRHCL